MPVYAGVDHDNGKALYYVDPDNGDYTTTDDYAKAKQSDLGSTLAKVYGGFGTQLNAYGVDLSVQFSYQLGGKLYDGTYEALMHRGDGAGTNFHKDVLEAWTPEIRIQTFHVSVLRMILTRNSHPDSWSARII